MLIETNKKVDRRAQDSLYEQATAECGSLLRRLARGYEAGPDHRRDLLQEIHLELWRSLPLFDHRCSLRTWVYRVAHNVAASHIVRQRRLSSRLVDLEALQIEPAQPERTSAIDTQYSAQKLLDLIHRLRPLDRQIILLYLEGEPATQIAEVTGLSASNIATKVHRIKKLLQQQYTERQSHARK